MYIIICILTFFLRDYINLTLKIHKISCDSTCNRQTVKSAGMLTTLTETGRIPKEDATSFRPQFTLAAGWGVPQETLVSQSLTVRLFVQKILNLKNFTEKFNRRILRDS